MISCYSIVGTYCYISVTSITCCLGGKGNLPRNASQPAFTTHVQGLPKNGSVPFFDRIRKSSLSERYKPTLNPIRSNSRSTMHSNGELKKSNLRISMSSFMGSRNNNAEEQVSFISMLIGLHN